MIAPATRVEILKAENRRLEEFLRDLPREHWTHPSPCAEWTIADVVAHLTAIARQYADNILKTLRAGESGPGPVLRTNNELRDARPLARAPINLRNELGEQLYERYVEANRAVESSFDQVGPGDWMKLCHRSTGDEPLASIRDVFIVEVGVHRWDVISTFVPTASVSPEGLSVMVGRYPDRPRWWDVRLPKDHPELPVRFRFLIHEVSVPQNDFVISADGEQRMEVGADAPATVVFHCDAETFILLAYGRIKPAAAVAEGRLTYTGDSGWADLFVQSFVGG